MIIFNGHTFIYLIKWKVVISLNLWSFVECIDEQDGVSDSLYFNASEVGICVTRPADNNALWVKSCWSVSHVIKQRLVARETFAPLSKLAPVSRQTILQLFPCSQRCHWFCHQPWYVVPLKCQGVSALLSLISSSTNQSSPCCWRNWSAQDVIIAPLRKHSCEIICVLTSG